MTTEDVYRTKDGRAYFKFRFVQAGSRYEMDIIQMPSYGSRSQSQHNTHRLNSNRGGSRVCVGDASSVRSLSDARKWARNWCEETWKYIQTGERF